MAEKTQAQKTLDSINATIEKRATSDHQSYTVNGISVTKMKVKELLDWKRFYEREVKREQNIELAKAGKKRSNKIQVRFV